MSDRTRESHYAFAAMEAIRGGVWDDWLHQLHAAMVQRQKTPEYKAAVLSGADIIVGDKP